MRLVVLSLACLAVCGVSPLYAQTSRGRVTPLFGSGAPAGNVSQSLGASGNLGANFYDLRTSTLVTSAGAPIPRRSGGATGGAALSYTLGAGQFALNAGVNGFANYYSTSRVLRKGSNNRVGASWGTDLAARTHLSVSGGLTSRPLRFSLTSANGFQSLISGDPNQAVDDTSFLFPDAPQVPGTQVMARSSVQLSHEFSRRLTGSVDYGYRRDFAVGGPPVLANLATHQVGSTVRFAVTRQLGVNAAYRMNQSRDRAGLIRRVHSADVGLAYNEGFTLQLSRNTTLTLAGGVAGYVNQRGRQQFRLNGNANLNHRLGRTWSADAGYSRGVTATEILFGAPVLYDRASAGIGGSLGARVTTHAGVNMDRSVFVASSGDHERLRATASAGVQTALTSYLAIAADYWYSRHQFSQDTPLLTGLGRRGAAQGLRLYVNSRVTIFSRARRPDATR